MTRSDEKGENSETGNASSGVSAPAGQRGGVKKKRRPGVEDRRDTILSFISRLLEGAKGNC